MEYSGNISSCAAINFTHQNTRDKSIPASRFPLLAAVGGSMVTRTASRRAFHKEGRGVVTQDMLPEVGKAFAEVFGEDTQGQDRGKL
jgi:ATP-dependent NAD(P)H-hydrate dehydratase